MPWPHDGEVAVVECRELRLTEALGHSQHSGVHEAYVQVGVGVEQLAHTSVVACEQILDLVRAAVYLAEQHVDRPPIALPRGEVVELHQHRRGQDPGLPGVRQQLGARRMICVVAVESGPQRTGVENQRNGSGS